VKVTHDASIKLGIPTVNFKQIGPIRQCASVKVSVVNNPFCYGGISSFRGQKARFAGVLNWPHNQYKKGGDYYIGALGLKICIEFRYKVRVFFEVLEAMKLATKYVTFANFTQEKMLQSSP